MAKLFQKISTGNSKLYYALLNSSDWIRKLVMVVVVVVYTYSPITQNDIGSFLAHTYIAILSTNKTKMAAAPG